MNSQPTPGASPALLSSLDIDSLSMRPTSPSPSRTASEPSIPSENKVRYEKLFLQECRGKPYLIGIDAAVIFLASHLHKDVLSDIWEQADVTRDGRFSCHEFCLAMWLIDQARARHPSASQPQHPVQNVPASSHQDTSSWTQPPAYTQQTSYYPTPINLPYGGIQSAGPLPQVTVTDAPGHDPYNPQAIEKREMLEPMICQSCDAGLVPGNIAYCCDACDAGVSTFCEACHHVGGRCYHVVAPAKLEAGKKLKNEDKDGDFGFGLKCDGCRAKLKDGAICWHCKRCFDPNFCADCWRRRDKRCKHATWGKVQLRRVGKPSVSTDDILDGLDVVGTIFGG